MWSRVFVLCLVLNVLMSGLSHSQPQDLPEYLAREIGQLQTHVATLEGLLLAVNKAALKAELEAAQQRERLYTSFTDSQHETVRALAVMKERLDRSEGRSSGMSQGWGILTGIIGMIVAAAALVNARRRPA